MNFQEKFVRNVRLYFREVGEKWLEELPTLLEYCEGKWGLTMKNPYELSINYVAPAIRSDGSEVVVKIGLPGVEFNYEHDALIMLDSSGVVRLIDADRDHGVLILEKVSPGTMLAELEKEDKVCQIASEVMKGLITPASEGMNLPSTKDREAELALICKDHPNQFGPFLTQTLKRALAVFTYMNKTMVDPKLLHGDFHHYNVLSNGHESWIAIDPKGLIGEVEYDLIQFLMNCLPKDGVFEVIESRVEKFTKELDLDLHRLLLWGYAHSVLSSVWTVDEKTGDYNKVFSQCPAIFEKLYQKEFQHTIVDFLEKRVP
ncbi:aminoglycoside phosphotransferase family protein [Halobacillus amylolyticus]|uniref:Aminoglycoside phosphotransferase family protein n=1 Tax=Halobacillus amylolyticus TaxID=2932259 RepID=A0ABY4HFY7_9BACI|nr:aminoglycoside phosphotransferase family protein [Halobacillus amylolyticus]UOR13808.1 aminoglycoside phosphotransferase family protein [Halobacillus amylolyticus]